MCTKQIYVFCLRQFIYMEYIRFFGKLHSVECFKFQHDFWHPLFIVYSITDTENRVNEIDAKNWAYLTKQGEARGDRLIAEGILEQKE